MVVKSLMVKLGIIYKNYTVWVDNFLLNFFAKIES